jgi:hypothetical protein
VQRPVGADPKIDVMVKRGKLSALHFTLSLGGDNEVAGSLGDGTNTVSLTGWRQTWDAKKNPAIAFAGYYTATVKLDPAGSAIGDATVPQGTGYLKLTCTTAGTLQGAGKLADGTAYSVGSFLGPNGELAAYMPLYSNKGSLTGYGTLDGMGALTADWTWVKQALTAASRSYRAGFGANGAPVSLVVDGNKYVAPAKKTLLFGVSATGPNGHVSFTDGGLAASATDPDADFTINSKNLAVFMAGAAANPGAVKLTLDATHGLFSGSFVLADPDPAHAGKTLKRTATFAGVLSSAAKEGDGYFLLPQLPNPQATPPVTSANAPILSGEVLVAPK